VARARKNLTAAESARGWVEFHCPEHGWLLSASPDISVRCGEKGARGRRCNKRAARILAGAPYDPRRDPRRPA